jgi:hypothetical protein
MSDQKNLPAMPLEQQLKPLDQTKSIDPLAVKKICDSAKSEFDLLTQLATFITDERSVFNATDETLYLKRYTIAVAYMKSRYTIASDIEMYNRVAAALKAILQIKGVEVV